MVDERPGSPEWTRLQAKLWCSLPSANVVRVQRVQNQKLWAAFVGPVAEFRDAGGDVRVGLDSSCVHEVLLCPTTSRHHYTPVSHSPLGFCAHVVIAVLSYRALVV